MDISIIANDRNVARGFCLEYVPGLLRDPLWRTQRVPTDPAGRIADDSLLGRP